MSCSRNSTFIKQEEEDEVGGGVLGRVKEGGLQEYDDQKEEVGKEMQERKEK